MTAFNIQPTFPVFFGTNGAPLENGYIWVGEANQDPMTAPVAVFWDSNFTQQAAQPLRTLNGYVYNNGTPSRVYVRESDYSLKILDKKGQLVYFAGSNSVSTLATPTLKSYGAIGDGSLHPLSERFSTLAEAQAVYPFVTLLSQQIDWAAAQLSLNTNNIIYATAGTYLITDELTVPSDAYIYGDGQGISTLLYYKASNPGSSEFMLAMRRVSGVLIEKITVKSNAYEDGLFDVGTYTAGPPKTYSGSNNGNINGMVISSSSKITVRDCEITGFNYDGIRVTVEGGDPATDYNYNLVFDNIYGHHCLVTPIDILGTQNYKVVNCTLTDNGNFTGQYIDGGTGYGVVLGRQTSGSQLRCFGGVCQNNFIARNARHGIDSHSGVNAIIDNNILEDNLLQGIGYQDIGGSADDSVVGDVTVTNNRIYHTDWVDSRYPLITWVNNTTERRDSVPIFVSTVGFNLLKNITIANNDARGWKFRQIGTNIVNTDSIGFVQAWAENTVKISNNHFEQLDTDWLPSFGLEINGGTAIISGNTWVAAQRSTVSKPWITFGIDANGECLFNDNHVELTNVYSDSGVTQQAYPTFRNINNCSLSFVGNEIVQTSQGTRGSLWFTNLTNQKWGFNGVLTTNVGNKLKVGGSTWVEYASRINGSLSIYVSAAGAGRYDGFSSGNPFLINTATALELILADMPICDNGLTVNVLDQINTAATGQITIPTWQDNIYFVGNSANNTNSMTKTAGFTTTGAGLYFFRCPDAAKNITFEYLYFSSGAAGGLVYRAKNVNYCAFEPTNPGGSSIIFSQQSGFCRTNRFKGGSAGVFAERASAVESQDNDSDALRPSYGLLARSSAIYKNGTQPLGSITNELLQNGGTIA